MDRPKPSPPVSAQRLIDAPAADWLSAAEVALWLHIGTSLLKELRTSGDFPPPVQFGRQRAMRWYWLDVVAWGHLRSIARVEASNGSTATGRRRGEAG